MERKPAVLLEVATLRGVEHEHVQATVDDTDRHRVDPRRALGAADRGEQGRALLSIEMAVAGGRKIRRRRGDSPHETVAPGASSVVMDPVWTSLKSWEGPVATVAA